jgi:GR25 family glycosyltransferase involved in LPS biosynthesis
MNYEVFYINMDRSEERRFRMERELNEAGLTENVYRQAGIIADKNLKSEISISELGAFLAHQKLISETNSMPRLILEDDTRFPIGFKLKLEEILTTVQDTIWDIIFLGTSIEYTDLQRVKSLLNFCNALGNIEEEDFNNYQLIPANPWYVYGCFGYIVNHRAVAKLGELLSLEIALNFPRQIDVALQGYIRSEQLTCYVVFPYLAGIELNIQSEMLTRSNPAEHHRKLTTVNLFVGRKALDALLLGAYSMISTKFDRRAFIASQAIYDLLAKP